MKSINYWKAVGRKLELKKIEWFIIRTSLKEHDLLLIFERAAIQFRKLKDSKQDFKVRKFNVQE